MFGRVENLDQLFIIDTLPDNKIYCDQDAKDQLDIMRARSENRNPPVWKRRLEDSLKISYLNINSLRAKMDEVKADPNFSFADIIIFGETWLEESTEATVSDLQLPGYQLHLNNAGRGKGLATYYKLEQFTLVHDITEEDLQLCIMTSPNTTIIGFYRSQNNTSFMDVLHEILPKINNNCVFVGDFNICSVSQANHPVLQTLKAYGFQEMVKKPTHLRGGHIDMVWMRVTDRLAEANLYSPYYTCKDHDCILISLYSSAPIIESKRRNYICFWESFPEVAVWQ